MQKFDQNGQYLMQWGMSGVGDGDFDRPTDIAIDSAGNVYITDYGNDRVQKFNSQGVYSFQWGTTGSATASLTSAGIAISSDNTVYVTD